jgi:putative membrane protein
VHSWYFTGLIPGIHINLIGIFLLSLSASLLNFTDPIYLAVFITAMAITHTFVDFIPSIFLGCPDTDTELSILPGHELLKKGQGYQAVLLTCYGSLLSLISLVLILIPFLLFSAKFYNFLRTPYLLASILIFVSLFLILLERKKFSAFFAFSLSGILGFCVLNLENLNQPLLPLLTGLFGSSMLILSIKNKIKIPEQKIEKPTEKKSSIARAFFGSIIASPICSFLPGLGAGQAAIIGNTFARTTQKGFLILLGATNTLVMGISFLTLYTISKTRTGAAATVKEIIGTPTTEYILIIIFIIFLSGFLAFFITEFIARIFSTKISKIDYTKLSIITLLILLIVTTFISGILGISVLIVSTFTGIYIINLKVRRTQMMGCLLLPTIIWYLI